PSADSYLRRLAEKQRLTEADPDAPDTEAAGLHHALQRPQQSVNAVHNNSAYLGAAGELCVEMERIEVARQSREFALIVHRKGAAGEGLIGHYACGPRAVP